MVVTLDAKRRLTVPAKPGDHFLVDFDAEEDALLCRRIASKPNWLKVLKESLPRAHGRSAAPPAGVFSVQVVSWLLDADVLSQPAQRHGNPRVIAGLAATARRHNLTIVTGNTSTFTVPA